MLKSFKLSVFYNVSRIWFKNEGPIKDKAFWPVFVFRKGPLSFKKLFLNLTLPSGANSKTSFKYYGQLPLINLNMIEITYCSNLVMTGNQFKSLNSLWEIVDILSNWRQKRMHLLCIIWSFFLVFVLNLGTMQNMCNQSVVALWPYIIIVVTPELKNNISYIKA